MTEGEEDVIYCQNCGQQLLSTANFCDRCGADIADGKATPPDSSAESDGMPTWRLAAGIIVGVGLVLVLGSFFLGLSSPTHEIASEGSWSAGEQSSTLTSETLTGTATLDSGEYVARTIQPRRSANYEFEIDTQSGGPIDVFFMERDEFDAYQDEEEHVFLQSLSEASVSSTTLSGTVASGDYVLVIDNTGRFGASPDGEVVVDATLRASV